jgi:flagellar biosynthesis component FlhA
MQRKIRGEGNLGCLITIIIILGGLYVGYKFGKAR